MSSTTTNFGIVKPEGTDTFEPLTYNNQAFDKIDSQMKINQDNGTTKATHTYIDGINTILREIATCNTLIFVASADYVAGSTIAVDGVTCTFRYSDGTAPTDGAFKTNQAVMCYLNGTILTLVSATAHSTTSDIEAITGDLDDLETDDKSNLVAATNELKQTLVNNSRRTRRNITSDLTNLCTAISEQKLEKYGYAIGDYFVGASGYYYYLADMDTYYGGYSSYSVISTHHCGIVVDSKATSAWLSSGSATNYSSSTLHAYLTDTVLANVKTDLTALFGDWSSHLLSHQILNNSIGTWAWLANQYISAMTEVQFYCSPIWSADGFQQGEGCKPLEIFQKFKYNEIYGNISVWLRSLCSASGACSGAGYGVAAYGGLSTTGRASGLILFH